MLVELNIRNLGVIESANIQFGQGFTAVTGETGAGKTMIIEAINLLVGGRSETGMVRHGADEARVEGRFIDPEAENDDEAEVILARVIPAEGRSRAYVNGNLATVSGLAELGARLVDLHGQHAHQSLLGERAQRAALDTFGRIDLSHVSAAKAALAECESALAALGGDEQSLNREADLLRYQLDEITGAGLDNPLEDEVLRREEELLGDVVAGREALASALAAVEDDDAAGDLLRRALAVVRQRAVGAAFVSRLEALAAEAAELGRDMRAALDGLDEDPGRLAEIGERRRLLRELCRKYGPALADVIAFEADARERLAGIEGRSGRIAELEARREALRAELLGAQRTVATARKKHAPKLAKAVEQRLGDLALGNARVKIEVPESASDPAGDGVVILLAANPGSPPAPLSKVASGGELARVMLALRLVLTQAPPTLVFDEVDAGIGGTAAVAVGNALREVSRGHQVFVVTHLAQVAARADVQVGITKEVSRNQTRVTATILGKAERVEEIARMLSGGEAKEAAKRTAREMLSA